MMRYLLCNNKFYCQLEDTNSISKSPHGFFNSACQTAFKNPSISLPYLGPCHALCCRELRFLSRILPS
jgi:hypothetical protein